MQAVQSIQQKSLWGKRIPTLLGVGILVVGLLVGVLFIGQGAGVFAPRATPETTPKNVKITNTSDSIFTVSFMTDSATPAYIKWGTDKNKVKTQQADDREQISAGSNSFTTHHITVRGLQPDTSYFFTIGTADGALYDNNGEVFTVKTTKKGGALPAAKTIYGAVTTQSGAPADGSLVYVKIPGAIEQSVLVKSGGWAVPLAGARTTEGSFAAITDDTELQITVQGTNPQDATGMNVLVKDARPVATLTFGKAVAETVSATPAVVATAAPAVPETSSATDIATLPAESLTVTQTKSETASKAMTELVQSSSAASLQQTEVSASASPSPTPEVTTVDLRTVEETKVAPTVTTTQPTITGQAAPKVTVKIEVHSDNQIYQQVVTDDQGNFSLDIAALKETLEPGEHTVSYSYTDPQTGKEITKTQTFTVAAQEPQTASQPYGSGNPIPLGETATTSAATATPSAKVATKSATASVSAKTATTATKTSTASTLPASGAIGTTLALIFGGIFFIISGAWSFWASSEIVPARASSRIPE